MHPCWESLLPSNLTDWVVIFSVSIHLCRCTNTLQEWPRSTVFYLRSTISTGPLCLSVGARVHCLLSFFVKSTSPEACYHKVRLSAPRCDTHHNYWHPWVGTSWKQHEWPDLWTVFHLSCDPSNQVWLREIRRAAICSHTRRVSKFDWDGCVDLASCGPHTHPIVLG